MAKTPSSKLTLKHIIGYGAGDCGGCFGLMLIAGYNPALCRSTWMSTPHCWPPSC